MQRVRHWYAESTHFLATIQMQNWYALCVIMLALVQSWMTNLAGLLLTSEVLIPSQQNVQHFLTGTHQQRFESIHLSNTRFGAFRCCEEAERAAPCEEDSHSQENPCASYEQNGPNSPLRKDAQPRNPARIQPKCKHQVTKESRPSLKKTTIPVEAAPQQRGPPVISVDKRLWHTYSGFTEVRSLSEATFEACTEYSSTRTSSSRTRWSSLLARIEAESDRNISRTSNSGTSIRGWKCYKGHHTR